METITNNHDLKYGGHLEKLFVVGPDLENTFRTIDDEEERPIKCVVFSLDESLFAWTRGKNQVVVTQWIRSERHLSMIDEADSRVRKKIEAKVISTGIPVQCLAFGSCTPDHVMQTQAGRFRYFDPKKEYILATGHKNGKIRLWDIMSCKLMLELDDHKELVSDLAFSPDGSLTLLSSSYDKTLKLWNLRDEGNMFKTLKGHRAMVMCCTWSPTSKLMASCGLDKQVLVWDMLKLQLLCRLEGHLHTVSACEFSPDGALLASSSHDTRVIVWDAHKGTKLLTLNHMYPMPSMIYAMGCNGHWVKGLRFLPHGMRLATYSDDHYIRVWDLNDCDDPEYSCYLDDDMSFFQVSPSGSTVVAATAGGLLHFYSVPVTVPQLSHLARSVVRKLTQTCDVNKLPIPARIKSFLKYNVWRL